MGDVAPETRNPSKISTRPKAQGAGRRSRLDAASLPQPVYDSRLLDERSRGTSTHVAPSRQVLDNIHLSEPRCEYRKWRVHSWAKSRRGHVSAYLPRYALRSLYPDWDGVIDEVLRQVTLQTPVEGPDDEKMTPPDELTLFQQRRIVRIIDAAIEFNFAVTRNLGLASFDPRAPEPPTRSFQHDIFFALVRDVSVLSNKSCASAFSANTYASGSGRNGTAAQIESHGFGKEILPLWLPIFCHAREIQVLAKLLFVAIS
ncbi:hypothetical protein NMY22_g10971 [Coprinellus aureogranulatus]|nr:hypothetical protein NMY22_g10971 [Coprinellus aureogranulatus]